MTALKLIFLIPFSLILFFSCSEKVPEKSSAQIIIGNITSTNFAGGVIWGLSNTGEAMTIPLQPNQNTLSLNMVPGNWSFSAMAWSDLSGVTPSEVRCAKLNFSIEGDEVNVPLILDTQSCTLPDFAGPSNEALLSGTLAPAKFKSCNNSEFSGAISSTFNCTSGVTQSLRFEIRGSPNLFLPNLTSGCVDGTSGLITTEWRLPASDLFHQNIHLVAYEGLGCTGPKVEFNHLVANSSIKNLGIETTTTNWFLTHNFSRSVSIFKDFTTTKSSKPENITKIDNDNFYFIGEREGKVLYKVNISTGTVTLIKNLGINTYVTKMHYSSTYNKLVIMGGKSSITQSTLEIWTSDGTEAGTTLQSSTGGYGGYESALFGDYVFLAKGQSDGSDNELYQFNITTNTLSLKQDINVGTNGSDPRNFIELSGNLYFIANDGAASALHMINGAYTLSNLRSGCSATCYSAAKITTDGTKIYINDEGGIVFRYDGAPDVTTVIVPQSSGTIQSYQLTSDGTNIYTIENHAGGQDLLVYDGATVTSLNINSDVNSSPITLKAGAPGIAISAIDTGDANKRKIYFSNGTTISAIYDPNIPKDSWLNFITVDNNHILFEYASYVENIQKKVVSISPAGTLIQDLGNGKEANTYENSIFINGYYYFPHFSSTYGIELYRTDSATGQSSLFKDVETVVTDSSFGDTSYGGVGKITVFGNIGFFTTSTNTGRALWKTDGTQGGTVKLIEYNDGRYSYNISIIELGGFYYFKFPSVTYGEELYKSDGTPAGTTLLKDIRPGKGGSQISNRIISDGTFFYFSADDGTNGQELWKSDGTSAGTTLVQDLFTGNDGGGTPNSSFPTGFFLHGGNLYFSANNGTSTDLYQYDGTTVTSFQTDLSISAFNYDPIDLGGDIIFSGRNTASGDEIFRFDGTTATVIKEIQAAGTGSYPSSLTKVGGLIFFTADNGVNGTEVWVTDGTGPGTNMLADTNSSGSSNTYDIHNFNGTHAYYRAYDGSETSYFISDGTAPVKLETNLIGLDYPSASIGSDASNFYFTAFDGTSNFLYSHDGTSLKKLKTSQARSFSEGTLFNNKIFFPCLIKGSLVGSELCQF